MPFQETETQAKLISKARVNAGALVEAFAQSTTARESVQDGCDRAAVAVDTYCCDLLDDLIAHASPLSCADTRWLRSRYLTLIVEFGSAIRDAIKDSEKRHAAAQVIQYRVLEHERHLRHALESAALSDSPVVDISPGTPGDAPLGNQTTYLARPDITPETV